MTIKGSSKPKLEECDPCRSILVWQRCSELNLVLRVKRIFKLRCKLGGRQEKLYKTSQNNETRISPKDQNMDSSGKIHNTS